jgi:hypothetical protein
VNWWKQLRSEVKILLYVTLISIVVIGLASAQQVKPPSGVAENPGIDTYIPKGFVLVPIEVQNYEALDSILGKYGIVDLFRNQTEGGRVLARNVRILRAPKNPSSFAVLVEEAQAAKILSQQGGVFVVVKPLLRQAGTEFVKSPIKRRIIFEGE